MRRSAFQITIKGGQQMKSMKFVFFGILLGPFAAQAAFADVNASIRGSVLDSSGAVVQGAEITATNTGTGIVYTTNNQDSALLEFHQFPPGVMSYNDRFGTISTNGSQTQQINYLINGTDSNDIALNTPGLIPSADAIQEFSLITSTINPEYGRNSGGILNAVIKSGTNQWHGGIFDFYRDTFLNARNFFTVGPQAPIFHQNQFGGTFGGPVIKDKTFFFLSYQGT